MGYGREDSYPDERVRVDHDYTERLQRERIEELEDEVQFLRDQNEKLLAIVSGFTGTAGAGSGAPTDLPQRVEGRKSFLGRRGELERLSRAKAARLRNPPQGQSSEKEAVNE